MVFRVHIAQRVMNLVCHTKLYFSFKVDGLEPFRKTGQTIHGGDEDILYPRSVNTPSQKLTPSLSARYRPSTSLRPVRFRPRTDIHYTALIMSLCSDLSSEVRLTTHKGKASPTFVAARP